MARGRFISSTLGRSKKYNQLPDHFTKLVYVHTLTAADEQGRIEADVIAIYGDHFVVDPEASLERIEAALIAMHRVGLIQLYESDGKRYAQFEDFHKHNTIRRDKDGLPTREGRSRVPPPPEHRTETAQELRDDRVETAPQVEVEVKDQVEVQEQGTTTSPNGDDRDQLSRAENENLQTLVDAWNEHRGPLPAAQKLTSTRKQKLKTLMRDLGGTEPTRAAIAIATKEVSTDDFWIKRGYGLDNLLAGQKVIQKAETAYNRGSFNHEQSEIDRILTAIGGP